jgi:hypothetical protein
MIRECLGGQIASEWKPGDAVEWSGVYSVRHGKDHTTTSGGQYTIEDRLIFRSGGEFPLCNECGNLPRFILVSAAEPVEQNKHFMSRRSSRAG